MDGQEERLLAVMVGLVFLLGVALASALWIEATTMIGHVAWKL